MATAVRPAGEWLAQALIELGPGERVYATGIPWAVYARLADLRDARRPGVKITFDRGRIELMSPSYRHEKPNLRLGLMVLALVEELGLEAVCARSTTFRREEAEQGLEPDDCFYIAHAAAVVGVEDIDLAVHPPPDLVIEVDVTSSSVPKEPIYAPMGVPELWRHEDGVHIRLLQPDQTYGAADRSLTFPQVSAADLDRMLAETNHLADIAAIRHYRAWAKTVVPPPANP